MACANADIPVTQLTQEAAEEAVLCLINERRAAASPPRAPLSLNLRLRSAARRHAQDAAMLKWWAGGGPQIHTNPVTHSTPETRIADTGYCPGETAPVNENGYHSLYWGTRPDLSLTTPRAAVDWWMGSEGHMNTLLDPAYTESGVAVVLGTAEPGPAFEPNVGGAIFVQTFGGCSMIDPPDIGQGWAWGANVSGQVGDGTTINRLKPVRPQNLSGVIAVAGGLDHSLALTNERRVLAWGSNKFGQLGDGTEEDRSTRIEVEVVSEVVGIAGGGMHSLAFTEDGSVLAWGRNRSGQLGNNSTIDRHIAVQSAIDAVVAIAAGYQHSLAITTDGVVFAWGDNEYGQLGDGTNNRRLTPVEVEGLSNVAEIRCGFYHSLARKNDGTVWAWGLNNSGQLGDSSLTNRNRPVRVQMPSTLSGPVAAIAAGGLHNLALEQNGELWAWGSNAYGQLGYFTTPYTWLPVKPLSVDEVTAIAAGYGHSLVIKRDGSVWAWGANYSGQLGDGTTIDRGRQVRVANLNGVVALAGGGHHSLAP